MLTQSDTPIDHAMSEFAAFGVEAGYLVPTQTGLFKGIMDAHAPLRDYLKDHGLHDYDTQTKGPSGKFLIDAHFIHYSHQEQTRASLYRPRTKQGDPRIWFYGLPKYAQPGNLLAIFAFRNELYVVNVSDSRVMHSLSQAGSPLRSLVEAIKASSESSASELLGMIRDISGRGYIPSMRRGPTGIGYTLETLLGIQANSRQAPDFKDIEIKAQRRMPSRNASATRFTLFSKTPDWRLSKMRNGREILNRWGYPGRKGPELYVTVTNRPNRQGLHLTVGSQGSVECLGGTAPATERVVEWQLRVLEKKLANKHQSTFWVIADTARLGEVEYFHYRQVVHSRGPLTANLGPLIMDGTVSLDFTLSLRESGATRDHGYLFKIWPESRHLLIPRAQQYALGNRLEFSAPEQ